MRFPKIRLGDWEITLDWKDNQDCPGQMWWAQLYVTFYNKKIAKKEEKE